MACLAQIARVAQHRPLGSLGGQGRLCALRYQPPLLLCQCRIQVQHERIGIPAQLGYHERDALGHQAGHKGHVTR